MSFSITIKYIWNSGAPQHSGPPGLCPPVSNGSYGLLKAVTKISQISAASSWEGMGGSGPPAKVHNIFEIGMPKSSKPSKFSKGSITVMALPSAFENLIQTLPLIMGWRA